MLDALYRDKGKRTGDEPRMQQILAFGADYDEYRRDESRVQGEAESISCPTTEDEVSAILS